MKKIIFIISIFMVLAFSGCRKNYAEKTFSSASSSNGIAAGKRAPIMAMSRISDSADFSQTGGNSVSLESEELASENGRKLIKSGSITIEVYDLEKADSAVNEWVKEFSGYVANSDKNERASYYSVRIPCNNFDSAMESCGKIGNLKNKGFSTQDVSEQFYDVQSRLETRKVLREKLRSYLKQASSMQDMLKVERELNSVQSEIESMEGRLKRLSSQIDFSTIEVNITLPFNTTQSGFELPDFGNEIRCFAANLVSFFGFMLTVVLYLVICGVPLVLLIAFLFWLLFGKVGLLIKLYKKLKG
ncbi:MAG: DUF4349 domain-containing protein [Treponema sp.]|nr:DUF4349 domain-containing protein [Treponema sp.]